MVLVLVKGRDAGPSARGEKVRNDGVTAKVGEG